METRKQKYKEKMSSICLWCCPGERTPPCGRHWPEGWHEILNPTQLPCSVQLERQADKLTVKQTPNIPVCVFMSTKPSFLFAELKIRTVTKALSQVTAFCSKMFALPYWFSLLGLCLEPSFLGRKVSPSPVHLAKLTHASGWLTVTFP